MLRQGVIIMVMEDFFENEPCYVISVAARMVGLHAQTLRYYERVGLVSPSRSDGRRRLYSPVDIHKLRRIKTLSDDMGVNLAGVEVLLKLMDRMLQMENEMNRLLDEVRILRTSSAGRRKSAQQREVD